MTTQSGTLNGSLYQLSLANATSIAADANGALIVGSAGGAGTITGDSGGPLSQSGSNWNILANPTSSILPTSGSSVSFSGTGSTLTLSTTDANNNTLIGLQCGNPTLSGIFQTGLGYGVLNQIDTGVYNVGLGFRSGYNYTTSESSNICINNQGVIGDNNTIRIGTQGNNNAEQNLCYIAGIVGVTTSNSNFVTIDTSTGQLGATAGGGGGISTINGDTGSATGATVTFNGTPTAGSSVSFDASGSAVALNVTDANSNTIIGLSAGNGSISGTNTTGLGKLCLANFGAGNNVTAIGYQALNGLGGNDNCTALGANAILGMFGQGNTGIGAFSLGSASGASGAFNSCLGYNTGNNLTSGGQNLLLGTAGTVGSGSQYTSSESSNILLNHAGVTGESNVMRLGTDGSGGGQVNATYVAGVNGVTVTGAAVLCATDGQFGTIASSERFKENIKEIKSSNIIDLTPVQFTYKTPPNPPSNYIHDHSIHYGMIAEDVAVKMPELVIYDEGLPFTIKYHEMYALLLAEIKSLRSEVNELKNKAA